MEDGKGICEGAGGGGGTQFNSCSHPGGGGWVLTGILKLFGLKVGV